MLRHDKRKTGEKGLYSCDKNKNAVRSTDPKHWVMAVLGFGCTNSRSGIGKGKKNMLWLRCMSVKTNHSRLGWRSTQDAATMPLKNSAASFFTFVPSVKRLALE